MFTKAEAQAVHTIRRAMLRLRQEWTQEDINICVNRIRSSDKAKWAKYRGTAIYLRAQSNRIKLFAVLHRGLWFPVVYDSQRKTLATILPPEGLVFEGGLPVDFRHKWGDVVVPEGYELARRALNDRVELKARPAPPIILRNRVMEA